jgi:hypothetical protein
MERDLADNIARLGELHRRDPEAFEALRKQIIVEAIEKFPDSHRARAYGLQFRLDHELSRYKDPISRMNRMVEIFWEGVHQFESVISNPTRYLEEKKSGAPGEVIPLRNRENSRH